jgi:maleamate amidohydrolase
VAEDLDGDYAAAGFAGRLGWGSRPAVVAIDVCRAYLDPRRPSTRGVEDALASIGRRQAARAAEVP